MKSYNLDTIKEFIEKTYNMYLLDILDMILTRFYNNHCYHISREIDGIKWTVNCVNPYNEIDP